MAEHFRAAAAAWEVELGKVLARQIVPDVTSRSDPVLAHDSSTNALIRRYRGLENFRR
jgi:glucose-6-phosphate isomerase